MILANRIKCKKCGDIIRSTNVHDFKYCKCGAVAVDGGHYYLRRVGELEDWEDVSIIKEFEWEKIANELDDATMGLDGTIEVSKDDMKCILRNLRRCAYGWAWSSEQLYLKEHNDNE